MGLSMLELLQLLKRRKVNYKIVDSTIELLVDESIYSVDVLHKCFYWYSSGYDITILRSDIADGCLQVQISPKNKSNEFEADCLISRIKQDLIDYKLRDIVTKETQSIRELIIAKAFAYYNLDTNPATDVSDPVGFNPNHDHVNG